MDTGRVAPLTVLLLVLTCLLASRLYFLSPTGTDGFDLRHAPQPASAAALAAARTSLPLPAALPAPAALPPALSTAPSTTSPPRPARTLLSRLARPAASAWHRTHLRVTVETHPWRTGGPEGLAQLLHALGEWGIPLSHLTCSEDVSAVFGRYTAGIGVWAGEHSRGDVTVVSEYAPCPFEPSSGVRQVVYELGTGRGPPTFEDQAHCVFMGHSHFTRAFVGAPKRALVRQWFDPTFLSTAAASISEAALQKAQVVVVDEDFKEAVPVLSAALAASHPGTRIEVLEGLTREQVNSLFHTARVIVDGRMMGMERSNAEATLQWVVPVMQRERAGADAVDYPHGNALRFSSLPEMVGIVQGVLSDYPQAATAAAANRAWHRQMRSVTLTDVARLFETAGLEVHVLACTCSASSGSQEQRHRAAVLIAAAVHLLAPLASVTLHLTPATPAAAAASTLLAQVAAGRGIFQHAALLYASPLCASAPLRSDAEALAALPGPFGLPEHVALLSWRALPVVSQAFTAWAESTRGWRVVGGGESGGSNSTGEVLCPHSQLRTEAGTLGYLLDGAGSRLQAAGFGALLQEDGTFANPPPGSGSNSSESSESGSSTRSCIFSSGVGEEAEEGPVYADLLPLLEGAAPPLDSQCQLLGDEAVLDVVAVLEQAALPVPAEVEAEVQSCARGGHTPRPVTLQLCSSAAFKGLAEQMGLASLCEGT